jgi:hypothetical protein
MSFPNPDNYARDCDCGTAGANTTPPPAQLIAEAEAVILTNPLILPLGGSIDTRNQTGTGGSINTSGFNSSGGAVSGGTINTSGGEAGAGGSINLSNSGGSITSVGEYDVSGGSINLSYAMVNGDKYSGGSINTSGGGSINTSNLGGSINLSGDGGGTAGGSITSIALNGYEGGSINLNAGSTVVGGSINTSNGGGSINTTGVGSIEFGVSGTRTTVTGTATADRAITMPNATGTMLVALTLSPSINFGACAGNGAVTASSQTVTGAEVGDAVIVTCTTNRATLTAGATSNIVFDGVVTATNTVSVRAHNPHSNSITLGALNFKVAIIKTA